MELWTTSQWPRGLRRRSAAARLLRSWVRIPPGAWIFVCCKCCVLSGRGLCDELITRPEESYRLCCVIVCNLENLVNEEAMTRVGSQSHKKYIYIYIYIYIYCAVLTRLTTSSDFHIPLPSTVFTGSESYHGKCFIKHYTIKMYG